MQEELGAGMPTGPRLRTAYRAARQLARITDGSSAVAALRVRTVPRAAPAMFNAPRCW
jgi:hypothetical protein